MPAAFRCRLGEFASSTDAALNGLIKSAASDRIGVHRYEQTEAWLAEFEAIEQMAAALIADTSGPQDWHILLEFTIPRRGRRPDAVLLADDVIFVIEFKTGSAGFTSADRWQAKSYALDLRDFHGPSAGYPIVPILALANATGGTSPLYDSPSGQISDVQCVGFGQLSAVINKCYAKLHRPGREPIDAIAWDEGNYHPTPTIIEASQRLFAGHTVADIAYNTSSNLTETTSRLVELINEARLANRRLICFVTGIPGAGKTLAGLNAAHSPAVREEGETIAVFLSGNGPLIHVIRSAIERDIKSRGGSQEQAKHQAGAFIRPVHTLIGEFAKGQCGAPPEHIIVFDEAQRAWNAVTTKDAHGRSEPEIFLEAVEQREEWSAIIALVGGGQEINTGEAGLSEWGKALNSRQKGWTVAVSPEALSGSDAVAGQRLFVDSIESHLRIIEEPTLHLSANVRSIRAQWLGKWVNDLLTTPSQLSQMDSSDEFPVYLTRDLEAAKAWIESRAEGQQRTGVLASSGAKRLRSLGIELSKGFRDGVDFAHWFLESRGDIRSSCQLEIAATEYECQGLEIDWSLVCWGQDFLFDPKRNDWRFRNFSGSKWQRVKKTDTQQFVRNKYRVVLTRARRGMIVFVPRPCTSDPSRDEPLLDDTATLLLSAGVTLLDE
jgi:hypothetical protein